MNPYSYSLSSQPGSNNPCPQCHVFLHTLLVGDPASCTTLSAGLRCECPARGAERRKPSDLFCDPQPRHGRQTTCMQRHELRNHADANTDRRQLRLCCNRAEMGTFPMPFATLVLASYDLEAWGHSHF